MHTYQTQLTWIGNRGTGTAGYRAYDRDYVVQVEGKPALPGSSDPAFRGDAGRYNPEELLLASLSACHMLWYLHLCSDAGVVVLAYADAARGSMQENADGSGQFTEVTLRPRVQIADAAMQTTAHELHAAAREKCFIARSMNFPVRHEPAIELVVLQNQ